MYERFYIVILCSTEWSANYLEAWSFLIIKARKSFCYKKVQAIFPTHFLQLEIYIHKLPEKSPNLKH